MWVSVGVAVFVVYSMITHPLNDTVLQCNGLEDQQNSLQLLICLVRFVTPHTMGARCNAPRTGERPNNRCKNVIKLRSKAGNRKLTDPPRAGFSWNVKSINSHRMQHNEKQNISPNNFELVRFFSEFRFVRIFSWLVGLQKELESLKNSHNL